MKKNKIPLVSIITPSYNSEKFISQTIESIQCQTHTNWELLITDDYSKDETVNIVEKYIKIDNRIKLYKFKKNLGSAIARNNSINNSSGEYIAFCDSDDLWYQNKLESQLQFMINKNLSFCFTGYEIIDYKGMSLNITVDSTQSGSFTYSDILKKKATIGCCTVMINKMSFSGLLKMPNIRTGQDYAFWLKLLKHSNHCVHVLPKLLSKYRISPNSISRNKFKKAKRQFYIYWRVEKVNFVMALYYFCFYAFRAMFRVP